MISRPDPKESVIETLCGLPDGLASVFWVLHGFFGGGSLWETFGSPVATPPGVLCRASLSSLRFSRTTSFRAPTAWAALVNMSVIQHGGYHGAVTQHFPHLSTGSWTATRYWHVRSGARCGLRKDRLAQRSIDDRTEASATMGKV